MLNAPQANAPQSNPQMQNHLGSTGPASQNGGPQRDRNRSSRRQQYRPKPRNTEEQLSSSADVNAPAANPPAINPQASSSSQETTAPSEAQNTPSKGAAKNEAFAALFAKSAKPETPEVTAVKPSQQSGKHAPPLAELEERMLANADASGLQNMEARLLKFTTQRAELDQLLLEDVKHVIQEAENFSKVKEAQRLLAEQLESERKGRKEVEEKLSTELQEKIKELQELHARNNEREQIIMTQEQRIMSLEAGAAEHQHRLTAMLEELDAAKHQYLQKNQELAKLQLENFTARTHPSGEMFRNLDVQAVLERAEADKNWYVQHLNKLAADNQQLEAQLRHRHPGVMQPPPPPMGLPPQDNLAGQPSNFGAQDADKMMYFGKLPPPGFQHPHYHPANGERVNTPGGPPGPPLASHSPAGMKGGGDGQPGPLDDPFTPSSNGTLDPQVPKPTPPGFRPDANQPGGNPNSGGLMVNGMVGSSQPLAPIGHPIGHPWRPPYENFANPTGSGAMSSPVPPPPADRHISLNSTDPVLNYPHHSRPAPPWGQPQIPISHPQKSESNKPLAPGPNNPALGLKPDQLPPGPHSFGPMDPKVGAPPAGPGLGGALISHAHHAHQMVHHQGIMGTSAAAVQMPQPPMRMSMRQEVVVTPLAPNRAR